MSDPVKNAEVEDVLSSIRRLVSEDKRPLQVPQADAISAAPNMDATAPASAATSADRLVLTPALRVDNTAPAGGDEAVVDDSADDIADAEGQDQDGQTQAAQTPDVYTLEDAIQTDEMQSPEDGETAEETSDDTLDRLIAEAAESAAEEDDAIPESAETEPEQTAAEQMNAVEEALAQDADDAAPVAEALAENYEDDPYNFADDMDPDGESADAFVLTNPETPAEDEPTVVAEIETPVGEEATIEGETSVDAQTADQAEDEAQPEEAEESPEDGSPVELSAKIAALETAIGGISDQWEPDGASDDAYAGSQVEETMVWEDDVPAQKTQAQAVEDAALLDSTEMEETDDAVDDMPAVEDSSDTAEDDADASEDEATGFALGADDQLLDEDTLREMINEIVHSELQGALGERITRNVRRLVRREIHRALTARDLG